MHCHHRFGLALVSLCVGLLAACPTQAQNGASASTLHPRLISPTSATLAGFACAGDTDSAAWFEWGTASTFSQITPVTNIAAGNGVVFVAAPISGLVPGGDYSCRLMVSNALGVVAGFPRPFTTGRRVALWPSSATNWPASLTNAVAIAGRDAHYLGIRNDSTVAAWGSNTYGESSVPPGATNVVAVGCGSRHSVAVRADGTVLAWGVNSVIGETAVPAGLSNVVSIAAGAGHNLALKEDGTVVGWGQNEFGQATVPAGLSNVVQVACAGWASLVLKNDGTLAGWGFGAGFSAELTNVVAITAGDHMTAQLLADGTVWASGSVGAGGGWTWMSFDGPLTGPGNIVAVSAAGDSAIGLASDGSVTNWGNAVPPPPGLNQVADIAAGWLALAPNVPPQVVSQTNSGLANRDLVLTLSASDANGDPVALRLTTLPAAGALYQYDGGVRGAPMVQTNSLVGDPAGRLIFAPATDETGVPYATFSFVGNDGQADSPPGSMQIEILGTAYAVSLPPTAVGANQATLTGVATPQGLATFAWFEWGTNDSYGFTTPLVALGGGTNMVRLTAVITNLAPGGIYHCRLVASNTAAVTTGFDQRFTTGRNVAQFHYEPLPPGLNGVTAIAVGGAHSMALRNDASVFAWGSPFVATNVPSGLSNIVQVSAGGTHCLALREDGWVYGWGTNSSYQLVWANSDYYFNLHGWRSNAVSVAAGGGHSMVLKADGTVTAWGNWSYSPPPSGLNNVVAIAAGGNHSLALKNDGTVVGWGQSNWGQAGPPSGLSNVVAIAAGGNHSLALKNDGTVVGWGSSYYGQSTLPEAATNVVAIAAGDYHSAVLRRDGTIIAWGYNKDANGIYIHGQTTVPAGLTGIVAVKAGGLQTSAIGNLPPQAGALTAAGPANYDLLLALPANDANGDPTVARITSLPANGSLYQFQAGTRGDLIASVDTPVTDGPRRVWFVPATHFHGVTTFDFLVNDGWVDSAPATVTLSITASARAVTGPSAFQNSSNVVLRGWGTGGGLPATAWFEWGTNSTFGNTTAAQGLNTSLSGTLISADLTELSAGGEYHFRLVVSNAATVARGAERIFTTGRPVVPWGVNQSGQAGAPLALTNAVSLAGGGEHSLALRSDGTVTGWGRNDAGQSAPPLELTNVTAIAAGAAHSLAQLPDGTVVGWGTNNVSQTDVPPGLTGVLTVVAGGHHNLALCNDGTVTAWGLNTSGQATVPGQATNVVAVAAGWAHSLALRFDGTVVGWGNNSFAQTTIPAGANNVVALAAAGNHSLALKNDGTVTAWGSNAYGESSVPAHATNVIALAAGTNQSFALRRDGSIVAWGRNDWGQCSPPIGLGACVDIAGGSQHALALARAALPPFATTLPPVNLDLTSATLRGAATANGAEAAAWFEWGTNSIFNQQSPPIFVTAGTSLNQVSNALTGLTPYTAYCSRLVVSNANGVATGRTVFFATGGRVRSWGTGLGGQTNVPPALAGVAGLSAGTGHALAALLDGSMWAWGTNTFNQLNVPPGATNIIAVAAGGQHSLALNAAGRVIAWGRPFEGQTNVPVTLSNVVAIAAGDRHSLALRADGGVAAWGNNSNGQTNVPPWLTNVVAIAAAGNFCLALQQNGAVVVWGSQTTLPSFSGGVTAIAASTNNVLLLKNDGRVVAWGNNFAGQTNVPASVSNGVDVAMGEHSGGALKSDRTVMAWMGYEPGSHGETNVPPGLTNVVSLVSAGYYSLALVAGTLPPRGFTLPPGPVTSTGATLNGIVALNDLSATIWFEWGTNGSFTQATAPVVVANSTNYLISTNALLTGLLPGGSYSVRLVASNAAGLSRGMEQRFTTGRKLLAWGHNNYGQTNLPPGLTNVVAVAGGQAHSAALLNDGTVRVWGFNGNGQTNVPPAATNVIAIASGLNHLLALRANRTLVAWGLNTSGQATIPAAATNLIAIACGLNHSLALRADGRVIAWGDNTRGQTTVPANLTDVAGIAGGGQHTLALRVDGTVRAWGYNLNNQTNVPANATNVVAVAAGDSFSLALRAEKFAVGWGTVSPASNNTNLIALAAGPFFHALALRTNGTVVGWGNNSYGQISSAFGGIAALGLGQYHSLILGPNAPPSALAQTGLGVVGDDLVLTPSGTDANSDLLNFRVATLPSAGSLFQYADGARGPVIGTPDTPLSDPLGRMIFAPGPGLAGWPADSFTFVANDGEADSAPAPVTVNLIAAPILDATGASVGGNGAFSFTFASHSNATCRVWMTTNLLDWSALGTATQIAPGQFQFMDPTATNDARRFYRVTVP